MKCAWCCDWLATGIQPSRRPTRRPSLGLTIMTLRQRRPLLQGGGVTPFTMVADERKRLSRQGHWQPAVTQRSVKQAQALSR